MFFHKAVKEDIEQLTNLRIAYLIEDNGKLDENDLTLVKRDLPDYFMRKLNKCLYKTRVSKERVCRETFADVTEGCIGNESKRCRTEINRCRI